MEERIDTTLGDLLVAINDSAFEILPDSPLAYLLAGLALEEILREGSVKKRFQPLGEATIH